MEALIAQLRGAALHRHPPYLTTSVFAFCVEVPANVVPQFWSRMEHAFFAIFLINNPHCALGLAIVPDALSLD